MRRKAPSKGEDIMALIVTRHVTPDKRLILAVCDRDILGKKFEDAKRVLDLSSAFFNGEERPKAEVILLMKKAYTLNIAGEESVELAIECGLIDKTHVVHIKNIPHAQAVVMN
jgi:uncharacterized protein